MFIILNRNKHSAKTYFSVIAFNLRGEKRWASSRSLKWAELNWTEDTQQTQAPSNFFEVKSRVGAFQQKQALLSVTEKEQKGKDLFSKQTTRLKVLLIHHCSERTGTALCIHAWTRRTTTTFIMSLAATSSNAVVVDDACGGKVPASKMEMLRPL